MPRKASRRSSRSASPAGASSRPDRAARRGQQAGGDDDVVVVVAGDVVEVAGAGDQVEPRRTAGVVDARRERPLADLPHRGHDIRHRTTRGAHVDAVAARDQVEPVEHGRAGVGVDVAEEDRRAGMSGCGAVLVPAHVLDLRRGRHRHRPVTVDAERDDPRGHADRRNPHGPRGAVPLMNVPRVPAGRGQRGRRREYQGEHGKGSERTHRSTARCAGAGTPRAGCRRVPPCRRSRWWHRPSGGRPWWRRSRPG